MRLVLTIQGPGESRSFVRVLKEGERLFVGRVEGDLTLPHRNVSRRHLGIALKDGRVYVGDLKSTCGTLLNGEPLNRARLKQGDRLQVGPFEIRVEALGGKAPAPTVSGWVVPLVGVEGWNPRRWPQFFRALKEDPRGVWNTLVVPQGRARWIGWGSHGVVWFLVALWISRGAVGATPGKLMATALGGLLVAATLSRGLRWALGGSDDRARGATFVLAVSALAWPVGVVMGLLSRIGMGPALGWALAGAALGIAGLGFRTLFQPRLRRLKVALAVLAGGLALFLFQAASKPKPGLGNLNFISAALVSDEELAIR